MLALVIAFFAVQAGYHGFTAALPVALVKAGLPDAEIGLIVGVASVVQVPAAFFAGGLIDRFGGPRVLLFGCLSYLAAALLLALPIAEPGGPGAIPVFVIARILQGIGVSTTTPSAFAVVPGLVERTHVGVGLAQAGAAQNLTMAIFPPLSLLVLDATSLHGVAALIAAVVAVGALLVVRLERSANQAAAGSPAAAASLRPRWVGLVWHRAWALPLLLVVGMTMHWGVVMAYLAQVAEPAGVNVGIFFTADAVAVFAFRIPVGWLVDRVPPRPFVLAGLGGLLISVLLLLAPPSSVLFVVSGLFAGGGGILVIGPLLMTMSHRSTDRDRGSAFAYFYVALALGNAIGSIGGAAFFAAGGFALAMVSLGVTGLVVAAVIAIADAGLGQRSGLAIRAGAAAAAD
jgi:MFS family permease